MVPGSKDGALRDATLTVGDFQSIRLSGANGLIGTRAGESAGFHVKLIKMTNDLSDYKIYFTSIARGIATCSTAACNALPAGVAGENKLEKYIADNLPPWSDADFAAEEAGLIDELTYVQQGRELEIAYSTRSMITSSARCSRTPTLAFVGYPFTDEVSHQFMGLIVKKDMDGAPNPYYDDADDNGVPDGLVSQRGGYIKSAYVEADDKLKRRGSSSTRAPEVGHDVRVLRPRVRPAVVRDQREPGLSTRRRSTTRHRHRRLGARQQRQREQLLAVVTD